MELTSQAEQVLVQGLKAREEAAFTTLYKAYGPALFGVLRRMVNDEGVAEDLLQDTFVKIWTNSHRYDPSQGRLFSWLLKLTRNIALDALRARKTRTQAEFYWRDHGPEQLYQETSDAILPQSLFTLVEPRYRPILELAYQGFSREEIAKTYQMPVGTVKTRLRAALNELKYILRHDIHHYVGKTGGLSVGSTATVNLQSVKNKAIRLHRLAGT